ncbi:hypothetical protein ACTFIW_003264 [Dictyostelium discoideum]
MDSNNLDQINENLFYGKIWKNIVIKNKILSFLEIKTSRLLPKYRGKKIKLVNEQLNLKNKDYFKPLIKNDRYFKYDEIFNVCRMLLCGNKELFRYKVTRNEKDSLYFQDGDINVILQKCNDQDKDYQLFQDLFNNYFHYFFPNTIETNNLLNLIIKHDNLIAFKVFLTIINPIITKKIIIDAIKFDDIVKLLEFIINKNNYFGSEKENDCFLIFSNDSIYDFGFKQNNDIDFSNLNIIRFFKRSIECLKKLNIKIPNQLLNPIKYYIFSGFNENGSQRTSLLDITLEFLIELYEAVHYLSPLLLEPSADQTYKSCYQSTIMVLSNEEFQSIKNSFIKIELKSLLKDLDYSDKIEILFRNVSMVSNINPMIII